MRAAVNARSALVFIFFLVPGFTQAAPLSTSVQCRVQASPLVFGTYRVFSASDTVAVGKIAYSCTASVPVRITVNYGAAGRALKHQADQAAYALCLDPVCEALWGDGSGGTQYYFDPAPPVNRPVAVYFYGRVLRGQDIPVGSFGASVTVTILW